MELQASEKVSIITKDVENYKYFDLNNVAICNSLNEIGESTSNNELTGTATDRVVLNNISCESNLKQEKKRKRQDEEEIEQKRIAQEKYDKELHEQRYKRLMHLLNRSQFYANFLTKKISQASSEEIKANSDEEKVTSDENISPWKKGKKKNVGGYDIRQYIMPKTEKKIASSRSQLNLTEEEIAKELLTFNEKTPDDSCKKLDVPKYFNGTLYKYQMEGLHWLKVLYENGLNGILADEMGLGKTVQIIALLCHLIEKRQSGPFLIIVPLSTMPNWILEFKKFAPSLPVIVFYGSKDERRRLSKEIKQFHRIMGGYKTQPVVITSFETPLSEKEFLNTQKWRYIIIDEGHRIKNHRCQLAKTLSKLHSTNRLLLTGTPLQNDLAELWSLLNFLLPEIFDDLAVFESWFNLKELMHNEGTEKMLKQEEEKHILSSLREILQPFMLRREKSDVHLNIPPKKELIVYAPLTHLQLNLYKASLNRDIHSKTISQDPIILPETDHGKPKRKCVLRNATNYYDSYTSDQSTSHSVSPNKDDENEFSLINSLSWRTESEKARMQEDLSMWKQYADVTEQNHEYLLRMVIPNRWLTYKKIVNHPYLLHYPLDLAGRPKIDNDIIKSSGKLMVMDAMLEKLKSRGHKVLLFSTMTMILDLIETYLSLRDYDYVRLDGNSKIEERSKDIQRFNTDPNLFLFLISTKAGGTGLNLAAADTVIIYDCDWNPQVDIQAMARCHRIGQTRPVVIYKLCTKGTIDETIINRAKAKRILERMVISKELHKLKVLNRETLMEFKQLLESEEFKVVTSTKEVFTEEELNKLMDRSDMVAQ